MRRSEHMFETFEGVRLRLRLVVDRATARLWIATAAMGAPEFVIKAAAADVAPCRNCVTRARAVMMQPAPAAPLMRASVLASDDHDFAFDAAEDGERIQIGGGLTRCQRCGIFWPQPFATTSEARPKGPARDLDDPAIAKGRRAARRRAAAAVLARRRAG